MRTIALASLILTVSMPLPGWGHGGEKHSPDMMAAKFAPEQQPWGIAGSPAAADREVTIEMSDAMRFTPSRLEIRQGETVRFRLSNDGQLLHEMVIGTRGALREHAEMMKRFPNMEHAEAFMAHVPAGERGEIVWTFNRAGEFDFACLLPGHYEAGMVGHVTVAPK